MSVLTLPRISPRITNRQQSSTVAPSSTFDLALQGATIVARLHNRDQRALDVHARSFTLEHTPAVHVVEPGAEMTACWQASGRYDLGLHSVHGTYRRISGTTGAPQAEAKLRVRGGQVVLSVRNPGCESIEVEVCDGTSSRRVHLCPFARRRLSVATLDGAYEVRLQVVDQDASQVLAGHL
ncbi:hypothetical protein GCM10027030_26580 [Luteococcus sediminum]